MSAVHYAVQVYLIEAICCFCADFSLLAVDSCAKLQAIFVRGGWQAQGEMVDTFPACRPLSAIHYTCTAMLSQAHLGSLASSIQKLLNSVSKIAKLRR